MVAEAAARSRRRRCNRMTAAAPPGHVPHRRGALDPLRRAGRGRRRELRGARRRGPLAHRPERRGEDHGVQRHHRLPRAERGRDPVPRDAPERPEAEPHRRARAGAHLPEDERLRRAQRARERPDRAAPALAAAPARDHARPALGRARGARRSKRRRAGSSTSSAWSARALELGSALPYGEQRLLEIAVALAARPQLAAARRAGVGHEPGRRPRASWRSSRRSARSASPCCWSSTT